MRNFSASNTINFVSYNVNGSEYCHDVSTQKVVEALALAFETRLDLVCKALSEARDGQGWSEHISNGEFEVLVELHGFELYVAQATEESVSRVFSYHNLNTGKSVIWAHVVL